MSNSIVPENNTIQNDALTGVRRRGLFIITALMWSACGRLITWLATSHPSDLFGHLNIDFHDRPAEGDS